MNYRAALKTGEKTLAEAGVPDPSIDAWYLLEYASGICRASYYADPLKEMEDESYQSYLKLIETRSRRIPLQHIIGTQEFMGLEFFVNENVLIPRQDTEILVETGLGIIQEELTCKSDESMNILDMCTGSGCILLSLLHYVRKNSTKFVSGMGTDISEQALAVAGKNAELLGIEARFVQSDLFEKITDRFSLILSNPPYIPTSEICRLQDEVKYHDPLLALDGKEDGLYFYRRIVDESRQHLMSRGILAFEIGADQADDVTSLMQTAGFEEVKVKKDLAGLDRVVYGRYS